MMGRRARLLLTAIMLVLSAASLPAIAQEDSGIDIREVVLEGDGGTQVTVSVTGDAAASAANGEFAVSEDGEPVDGVQVTPLSESVAANPIVVVMAIDVSGSTEGPPLDRAKGAARSFVDTVLAAGAQVGLVTFADEAVLRVGPTTEARELNTTIDGLEAGGETALNDAVVVAARTLQNFDGQRSIVLFSDGADTVSTATVDGASAAVDAVDAAVSTVALQTGDLDLAALERVSQASGGQVVTVDSAESLQSAFGAVAEALTSQYLLTYDGVVTSADELELTVTLTSDRGEFQDRASVLSSRTARTAGEPRVVAAAPSVFSGDAVLYGSLAAVFLGLLLFLGVLVVPRGDRRVSQTLRRGLRIYNREGRAEVHEDLGTKVASSSMTRGAVDLVARVPRPEGYDDRIQLKLDRAGWALRATEFTAARVALGLVGVVVGWGLLGNVWVGLLIGVAAAVAPGFVLDGRVASRQSRFLAQLPDTLQLMAGALKAGYGILQAIDTVVKESPEPTASEFSRVLTESRLGLPLEDSLESMAERVGSDDFRWVVVAINIQRRVGGNLAELLDTVADTLREREMVRRQIKTLTAEGRLSAIILTILPFAVGLYLFVINPDYIGVLFERQVGLYMMGGAFLLIGAGIVWMRKLIDIDV